MQRSETSGKFSSFLLEGEGRDGSSRRTFEVTPCLEVYPAEEGNQEALYYSSPCNYYSHTNYTGVCSFQVIMNTNFVLFGVL